MNCARLFARDAFARREAELAQAVQHAEVEHLRAPPLVRRSRPRSRTPKTCAAVAAWMSSSFDERLDQRGVLREVRHDAQLDLRVVGREQDRASGRKSRATKQRRIALPRSVRTGMFCRFGSCDDSRPVAATVWLKFVWMRPVFLCTSAGSASM